MAHDVFISHATENKVIADAVCATLEANGIRCWIAPRDIRGGDDWGAAIVEAIHHSRAFVLVFSAQANASHQIPREVERAIEHGIPIVPFRIEDVLPQGSLEYQLATVHWLDAMSPPLEAHIRRLGDTVRSILGDPALPPIPPPPPVPGPLPAPAPSSRAWMIPAAIAVVAVAGIVAYVATRPTITPAPVTPASSIAGPASAPPVASSPVLPETTVRPPTPAVSAPPTPVSTPNPVSPPATPPASIAPPPTLPALPAGVPPPPAAPNPALERLKDAARSGTRMTCTNGFCQLPTIGRSYPAVARVRFGESAGALDRVIDLPVANAAVGDRIPTEYRDLYAIRYIPYRPGAREMYVRFDFIDGTTSDVQSVEIRESDLVAGLRLQPTPGAAAGAAPALFASFSTRMDRVQLAPAVPLNTAEVLYAVGDAAFVRARSLGGSPKGFQFDVPLVEAPIRLRLVMDDGREAGPFPYAAVDPGALVLGAYAQAFADSGSSNQEDAILCTRVTFAWPASDVQSRGLLQREGLDGLRSAPALVCRPNWRGPREAGLGAWAAIKTVTMTYGPDGGTHDTPLSIDWRSTVGRRGSSSPAAALNVWNAVLPPAIQSVLVRLTFYDGTRTPQFSVPIRDLSTR